MIMTLNDLLTKQNVITKLILKDGDEELSKELKVKIMRIRFTYKKIKSNFDNETQEFVKELLTDEFNTLNAKTDRTEEEEARYNELNTKINSEYQEFLIQKGEETVELGMEDKFTEDEFEEILNVNSGNDVEINGNKIAAPDFLEIVYSLFVA